jgi:hypothetical protein
MTDMRALTLAVAQTIREAGEDGISEHALEAAVDTRWVRRHISALNRSGYTIGFELDEGERWYFLVTDPESAQSREPQGRPYQPSCLEPAGTLAASPSAAAQDLEGRLFELAPVQHFDAKAEAA